MNADEFAYALYRLATDAEPEGMMNPTDDDERERLAVACIRGAKDAEGIEPETERELFAEVQNRAEYYVSLSPRANSAHESFFLALARGEVLAGREFASRYPQPDNREPFAFFRAKLVNVNGKTLKLKWAV